MDEGVAEAVVTLRDAHVAHLLVQLGDGTLEFGISLLDFTATLKDVFIITMFTLTVLLKIFFGFVCVDGNTLRTINNSTPYTAVYGRVPAILPSIDQLSNDACL